MLNARTGLAATLAAMLAVGPTNVTAHPHVFIDTGLEVIFDAQGRLTHVKVTWKYDDLYSLLLAEDYKVDADGDGALTDAERTELTGFDADWVQGYAGDLEVMLDGQVLILSRPMEPTADMVDGRIISSHLREVTGTPKLSGDPVSFKAFDPSYYTAYDMTLPVTIAGRSDCKILRIEPDIDGQLAQMQAQLLTLDANADLEENDIPMIGGDFATNIRVTCPAL
jgi:polyphosphate kinase